MINQKKSANNTKRNEHSFVQLGGDLCKTGVSQFKEAQNKTQGVVAVGEVAVGGALYGLGKVMTHVIPAAYKGSIAITQKAVEKKWIPPEAAGPVAKVITTVIIVGAGAMIPAVADDVVESGIEIIAGGLL